jgi:hypothetical protein
MCKTEDALVYARDLARDLGFMVIDGSRKNTKSQFNQMTPVNMSLSGQIADRVQLSGFFQNKAFEKVGFTQPRLGAASKYETAEGVKQGLESSFAQTEVYFQKFFDHKSRALEIHLNVAQAAQKSGKDITLYYSKSDATKGFLQFTDEDFSLRKFGILAVSNAKKRKELEGFKNHLLSTNTMGTDELAFAQLISADSFSEVINHARQLRVSRESNESINHQRQLEQIELQNKLTREREVENFMMEEESKDKDRANKIRVEELESVGRASDSDATVPILNYITQVADRALREEEQSNNFKGEQEDRRQEVDKLKQDASFKNKELALRAKELIESRNKRLSAERIARMNKN